MTDINDEVRSVVVFGLGNIPTAGALIAALADALWPATAPDVWGPIRADVEALVEQKIADFTYQFVSDDLQGLRNVIAEYTTAAHDSAENPTYISEKYVAALDHFAHDQPHFQAGGFQVLLLPLFAQFANLHLSLLRDGVMFGASWGWTPEAVVDEGAKLRELIRSYGIFARTWYGTGYAGVPPRDDPTTYRILNWKTVNRYAREMTMDVLDHAHFWPFFDPRTNPGNPALVSASTRTIYSDPIGTADDTGIRIPTPPTTPITGMNILAWDYVDAIQVAYGGAWAPRMGSTRVAGPSNGWNGSIDPVHNPVERVTGYYGQLPDSLQLWFADGWSTNLCGGRARSPSNPTYPVGGNYDIHFDGHVLSTIVIMGISNYYGTANCVVFGFRLANSFEPASRYVPNPGRVFVSGKTLIWYMEGSDWFMVTFAADGTGVLGGPTPGINPVGGGLHNIFNHPGDNFRWNPSPDGIDIQFLDGPLKDDPPLKFTLSVAEGQYQLEVNHATGMDRTYRIYSKLPSWRTGPGWNYPWHPG
jgi:hypothetical protein